MPIDIGSSLWLDHLLARELAAHEPVTAQLRIPPDLRDPAWPLETRARMLAARSARRRAPGEGARGAEEIFLDHASARIDLVLDVALLAGSRFDPARRRAEVAALLAALAGALPMALAADPGRPRGGSETSVRRALAAAAASQRRIGWPPGDPRGGLTLSAGELALEGRLLGGLAASYYLARRLDEADVRRRLSEAQGELALLFETLAAHASAAGRYHLHQRRRALERAGRRSLGREVLRRLRERLRHPRGAREIVQDAPAHLHALLLEQILLAEALSAPEKPAAADFVAAFAAEAGIAEGYLAAMRAEAALRSARQLWLDSSLAGTPAARLADGWGEITDQITEKVAQVVTDNLEAIVTEVRQTGELGQLLAKAAAGRTLSSEERGKVKEQLLDLAKAVPALAIFAAPGGMLLLPLLAKLLPFSVLPSAWDKKGPSPDARGRQRPGGATPVEEPPAG